MIVFGWNSILLLKILAHEAGFAQPNENVDYHIEIRQKYFHLMWIPFFPIGKMYALRQHADNELYNLTPEALTALQQRFVAPKAPWYTYSLFILIALLIISGIMSGGK